MKKTALTILILVLFANVFASAQNAKAVKGDEVVNIREIVQNQINEIKAKEAAVEKENVLFGDFGGEEFFVSRSVLTRLYIFIEGSLLIIILIYLKRKFAESKKYRINVLKENIKKLRAEKIGSRSDKELYLIRKKLRLQPAAKTGREITMRAKKMKISKGEIYLAAKLQMMTSQNR